MDPHVTLKQAALAADALGDNKSALTPAGLSQLGLLKQQAPDIKLMDQAPPHFDRAILVSCITSLLQDPKSKGVVTELIDSATTRIVSWPGAESEQWFDPTQLQGYQPHTSYPDWSASPLSSSAAGVGSSQSSDGGPGAAPPSLITSLNLYKLHSRFPSSENEYKLEALDDQWQTFLVVIYSLTAITSFILNVITVIVLARCQRSELRKYLINLSLSDLLMSCFSIPFTYTEYMLGSWIFAPLLCPIGRFVVTLSVFVSIATMTVIGINRHSAIMHPLKRKKQTKFRHWTIRKTHVILGIWLLGIAISLPEYLMFSAEPFCYNRQLYYDCRSLWPDSISDPYTVFIYMSTFVVPLGLLSYLYVRIGLKLWYRQMPGNVDVNRDLTMQIKRAKVVKMLLVIVFVFVVSWLPLQTFSMVMFLWPNLRSGFGYRSTEYNIFIATYFASHWLSMAHSCLNPLIYCFMNKNFRTDLHNLICGLKKLRGRSVFDSRQTTIQLNPNQQLQQMYQHPPVTAKNSNNSNNNVKLLNNNNNNNNHHHHYHNLHQKRSPNEASTPLDSQSQNTQEKPPNASDKRLERPEQANGNSRDQKCNKPTASGDTTALPPSPHCICKRMASQQQQRGKFKTCMEMSAPCTNCSFFGLKLPVVLARQLGEVNETLQKIEEKEAGDNEDEEKTEDEEVDGLADGCGCHRPAAPDDLEGRRVVLRHDAKGVSILVRSPNEAPVPPSESSQQIGGHSACSLTSCRVTNV